METLEKIAPVPVRIDIAGERVSITPIRTRELPGMMRAIGPILAEVKSMDVIAALTANADALIDAVAIGARMDRSKVDELELDDLLALAGAVLESNADFFARRVLPSLTGIAERVTAALGRTQ